MLNLKFTEIYSEVMESRPFETDFERQKKILFDRYMRLRQTYEYGPSDERYKWVETAAKVCICDIRYLLSLHAPFDRRVKKFECSARPSHTD